MIEFTVSLLYRYAGELGVLLLVILCIGMLT